MEPRKEAKPDRFRIEPLEERIAPATLRVSPPGGPMDQVPPGGATVNDAAKAADGAGGVVSVT
jgi:hypothetical protein